MTRCDTASRYNLLPVSVPESIFVSFRVSVFNYASDSVSDDAYNAVSTFPPDFGSDSISDFISSSDLV